MVASRDVFETGTAFILGSTDFPFLRPSDKLGSASEQYFDFRSYSTERQMRRGRGEGMEIYFFSDDANAAKLMSSPHK